MARNYMQDITPPDMPEEKAPRKRRAPAPETILETPMPEPVASPVATPMEMPERSIRSIRPSPSRLRQPMRAEIYNEPDLRTRQPRHRSHIGMWVAAIIALLVLAGAAFLILFPSTSVTVVPHTQIISFDASSPFTAYPEASAAAGTIAYTVLSQTFEDSTTVQANGTENAQEQATGNVIVYNEYSDQPVRLIKNTRLQTPEGLIFRIPASVDVPGRTGATPGSIEITIFADQTGPAYNVGPFNRLTLPGLKSSADMYEKVYAKSTAAFTGGFEGERPAVSPTILDAAKAEVRGRLQEKAQQLAATAPEGSIAFPGLVAISFETLPPTPENGGNVRINERAVVSVPVFPEARLAQSIGQAVSANAEGQSVDIRFANELTAAMVGTLAAADLGAQPVVFTLGGRGQLVWSIDSNALTQALGGREEAAFETVIQGFPSIEEARARIMPFWRKSFPEASKIEITVESPPAF